MVKVKEDMTGWVMAEHGVPDSRLTVIKQAEDYINPTTGKHLAQWLCECNCEEHNRFIARGVHIKYGKTKSCGCLRNEKPNKRHKKNNKWLDEIFTDEYGDYRIGFTSNTNNKFYVDVEDYDRVKEYCWYEHILTSGYHTIETVDPINKKTIRMPALLNLKYYDHIDRNTLNNRRSNLRPATAQENVRNCSISKNNKSGIIGVYFNQSKQRWMADITINGKSNHIYRSKNKEDTIRARLEAESKYFGEFAPQRHLFEQYGITTQNELEESDGKEMDSQT